jgi:RNA-directed DNA polymerase
VTIAGIIYCVGGVFSPVMCNVYLHRLDRAWDDGDGVLVRFADDLVVMCWSRGQAEAALARLTDLLAGLGLEPKAAKTRIVHLEEGGGVLISSAFTTGWCARGG